MANDIQINLNKFFENPSFSGKKIGVALSGGRDSVALAYAMKTAGIDIVAINVEHGIRGESSLNDSKFVADSCKKFDIPLFAYSVDVPSFCEENGYTLEQGARILRYEIFDKVIDEGICAYIALAHHLDDQVETLFMRIIRGTGVKGLCGMKEVSGRYIRPLLGCQREDIDDFVATNGLHFVEDETNSDEKYTRNFLRAELKRIKERFPSFCTSVSRLCENASEICDYLDEKTPSLHLENGEVKVDISLFDDVMIAKLLVMKAVNLLGVCQDIEQRHFPLVFELAKAQNGKRIELTHGIRVHKDGNCLVFSREENVASLCEKSDEESAFCEGKFENLGVEIKKIEVGFDENCVEKLIENAKNYDDSNFDKALYIDAEKLPDGTVLRNIKRGDYIKKFGGGRKSVGDFLTDKKVPLRKRDSLAVVAKGSEVFAIFGVEISSEVKLDGSTKIAYKLTKI